jgi:uncharacterized protein YuzE
MLDEAAQRRYRLTLTADHDPLAAGITLDFDADGRVIGVGFDDARGQISDAVLQGDPPLLEFDSDQKYGEEGVGMAYLELDPRGNGRTQETVVIDDEEARTTGDVNLDLDLNGRLLGIEFVDARDVPPVVLERARQL